MNISVVPVSFQNQVLAVEENVAVVVAMARGPKGEDGSANLSDYYTKVEVDTLLDGKTDIGHTHVIANITDFDSAHINGGVF